jgi:YD repeat-containing protein
MYEIGGWISRPGTDRFSVPSTPRDGGGRRRDSGICGSIAAACLAVFLSMPSTAAANCVGDCDGDGVVRINELIIGVNIALGERDFSLCPIFDTNGNGRVDINELIIAVNFSLDGCPPCPPTPTPGGDTPTPGDGSPTPTGTRTNQPPSIAVSPPGDKNAVLGQALVFSVNATDPDCSSLGDDCDPSDQGTDALALVASPLPLPPNATFSSASGQFRFSPAKNQAGLSFEVTFTASDTALSAAVTVRITVEQPAGVTTFSGFVQTTGNVGLPNVRMVLGLASRLETRTGADGAYSFSNVPFSGQQRLLIDGSTVDGALGVFAIVPEVVNIIEGGANVLDPPIFLFPLDFDSGDIVDPDETSIITSSPVMFEGQEFPAIELTVPPGTARNEATGEMFAGRIHITSISDPAFGPRPLPDDIGLSIYVAVQPFGVEYDVPVPISFPNVEGFRVGTIVDIFGIDHDTGVFEKVGEGRVLSNGMVESIGGVVRSNSWHGFVPQEPEREPDDGSGPGDCGTVVAAGWTPADGTICLRHYRGLQIPVSLPGYMIGGHFHSRTLRYTAAHAQPSFFASVFGTPGNTAPLPLSMYTQLTVAGISDGKRVDRDPSFCGAFNCPITRFSHTVDASLYATGVYSIDLDLVCEFRRSFRRARERQTHSVINLSWGALGAGFWLDGHKQLHLATSGQLLLVDGSVDGRIFTPALCAADEISEPGAVNVFKFYADAGERITVQMRRQANLRDGTSSLDPHITVEDVRGIVVANDDNSLSSPVDGPGEDAIVTFTAPQSGFYTVLGRGVGATKGTYDLCITTESDTALYRGVKGTPTRAALEYAGEIANFGDEMKFTFVGDVGKQVLIEVDAVDTGTERWLNPAFSVSFEGQVIGGDDDSGSGNNARALLTLPATGPYEVTVVGSGLTTGPFNLTATFDLGGHLRFGGVELVEKFLPGPGVNDKLKRGESGGWELWQPDGSWSIFDDDGFQTSSGDRNGNTELYRYDDQWRLAEIEDPLSQITQIAYGAGIVTITDSMDRATSLHLDAQHRVTRVTYPDDNEQTFGYGDGSSLIAARTSQRGNTTSYGHDGDLNVSIADMTGKNVISKRVRTNQGVGMVPPRSDAECQVPIPPVGCPGNQAMAPTVVDSGVFDGGGNQTRIDVDRLGHTTRLVDRLNRQTQSTYRNGREILRILANNARISKRYDGLGNPIRKSLDELGAVWKAIYGSKSELREFTDANGNTTRYFHDDAANLIEKRDPNGAALRFLYDQPDRNPSPLRGLLTEVIHAADDPELETRSSYFYDVRGNLIRFICPEGYEYEFEYNLYGYVILIKIGIIEWRFGYDIFNRLIRVVDPFEGEYTLERDREGHIIAILDVFGRLIWGFEIDECGRLRRYFDFFGRVWLRLFDRNNNLLRLIPPESEPIDFIYNSGDELRQITYGLSVRSFTYSIFGFLLTATDEFSRIEYQLDRYGRHTAFEIDGASCQPDVRIDYTLDLNGNIRTLRDSFGGTATYEWTKTNLLKRLNAVSGDVIDFDRDVWGRLNALRFHSGYHRLIRYTAQNRIAFLANELSPVAAVSTSSDGADLISSYGRFYDGPGNVTRWEQERSGLSVEPVLEFDYDAQNFLVGGTDLEDRTYDDIGNPSRDGATYDERNQIGRDDDFDYFHDILGRRQQRVRRSNDAETTYGYDVESRLIRVVLEDGTVIEYAYDAYGRRIKRTVDGVSRSYVYHGRKLLFEFDEDEELIARHTFGSNAHELLMVERDLDGNQEFGADERFTVAVDPLCSVSDLVGRDGVRYLRKVYGVDGETTEVSGPLPAIRPPLGWRALLEDPDTGLLLTDDGRDYDPATRLFLQPRVEPGLGRLPITLQPYIAYANNPPSAFNANGTAAYAGSYGGQSYGGASYGGAGSYDRGAAAYARSKIIPRAYSGRIGSILDDEDSEGLKWAIVDKLRGVSSCGAVKPPIIRRPRLELERGHLERFE